MKKGPTKFGVYFDYLEQYNCLKENKFQLYCQLFLKLANSTRLNFSQSKATYWTKMKFGLFTEQSIMKV